MVHAHQRRQGSPNLAVSCQFGYVNRRDDDTDGDELVKVIIVQAQNAGVRPLEIRTAGFVNDTGDRVYRTPYSIEPADPPHVLNDGESMRFNFRAEGDVPPERTFEVTRVFVDTGQRIWEHDVDGWPGPLTIERRWSDG